MKKRDSLSLSDKFINHHHYTEYIDFSSVTEKYNLILENRLDNSYKQYYIDFDIPKCAAD